MTGAPVPADADTVVPVETCAEVTERTGPGAVGVGAIPAGDGISLRIGDDYAADTEQCGGGDPGGENVS